MLFKRFIIYLLWSWLIIFVISSLLSYSNSMDVDGSLRIGFPFAFYDKSANMGGMASDDRIFSNFMFAKLFKDLGASLLFAIIFAGIVTGIKSRKR